MGDSDTSTVNLKEFVRMEMCKSAWLDRCEESRLSAGFTTSDLVWRTCLSCKNQNDIRRWWGDWDLLSSGFVCFIGSLFRGGLNSHSTLLLSQRTAWLGMLQQQQMSCGALIRPCSQLYKTICFVLSLSHSLPPSRLCLSSNDPSRSPSCKLVYWEHRRGLLS